MPRFHALEWEDLQWFPKSWRDYGTDYLQFIANKFKIYKPILPIIEKGLDASSENKWLDCASGGGGGLLHLVEELKQTRPDLKVMLSDFYPNQKAFEKTKALDPAVFDYVSKSVDACNLPDELNKRFRTMFGSFHHFRPTDAKRILQNAVDHGAPIAIFEPVGRNFASWFSMLFVPLNVLILTPFIRPIRWSVLPFIYILPLIPLYILWDGIASILRTYSEKELKEMVRSLDKSETYEWEIGKIQQGPSPIYYLLGRKK
jgi:hypothetical protein